MQKVSCEDQNLEYSNHWSNCFYICTDNIYEDVNNELKYQNNYQIFVVCSLLLFIVFNMCVLALIMEGIFKDPLHEILNSFLSLLFIFIFSYSTLFLFIITLFLINYIKLCCQSCKIGYKNRGYDYRYFDTKIEVVTNKELIID